MRLITPIIQQIGRQKIVILGSVSGLSINGTVYEIRNNGAVSYTFIDTEKFSIGRVELVARFSDGSVKDFSLNLQKDPVALNYDVLNKPISAYRTNTELNNESLSVPFDEVTDKFNSLVDQLRQSGIIV